MGSHGALIEMEAQADRDGGVHETAGDSDREQLLDAPAGRAAAWITTECAVNASWLVNWALLIIKLVAFIVSNSKAVLASLADSAGAEGSCGDIRRAPAPELPPCVPSAVDLASQGMLALAERMMKKHDDRYPVGRARLEAFAVIGCASLMLMSSFEMRARASAA